MKELKEGDKAPEFLELSANKGGTVVLFGNLAPDGAVIKSTALDPAVVDADGVFRHTGPARVFTSEPEAIAAIKDRTVGPGDVLVMEVDVLRFGGRIAMLKSCGKVNGEIVVEAQMTAAVLDDPNKKA